MTDYELMVGVSTGNIGCYQVLMERYIPYVVAIILRVSNKQLTIEDREELASDVFVKLWEQRENLSISRGKEKAYIGTIARNMTLNLLKKKGLHQALPLEESILDLHRDIPEKELLQKEERQIVREAVDSLGEPDREIFVRRYFYFEKVIDIAKVLGMKEQTVATKLYRGKEKLEKYLRERGIKG